MNFEQTPEFQKDLKRLTKKWRSLPIDITDAQMIIADVYSEGVESDIIKQKFYNGKRATRLLIQGDIEVVKMRLDVADLGRNDKARIIFVAIKEDGIIRFIELYAKNEKEREDQKRIDKSLK